MALRPRPRVRRQRVHHYTAEERQRWLDEMVDVELEDGSIRPPKFKIAELAKMVGAPPESVLRDWLKQYERGTPRGSVFIKRDFSSLLTEGQKKVTFGWVLHQLKTRQAVQAVDVQRFISCAFGIDVSRSWVARAMAKNGFSSHRPRAFALRYVKHNSLQYSLDFIAENQKTMLAAHGEGRLVAMDQTNFYEGGLVTSTYAPCGGYGLARGEVFFEISKSLLTTFFFSASSGQPPVLARPLGIKTICYTCINSNGKRYPPVLFTDEDVPEVSVGPNQYEVPGTGERFFAHHFPDIKCANTTTTKTWWGDMTRAASPMSQDAVLLLDKAPWHDNPEMRKMLDRLPVKYLIMPGTSGKYIDPLDQCFHREMKREFAQVRKSEPNKLYAVVRAYYRVSRPQVHASWDHACLLRADYEARLTKIAREGYRAGAGREEDFAEMEEAYDGWKTKEGRRAAKAAARGGLVHASDDKLDGPQWQ